MPVKKAEPAATHCDVDVTVPAVPGIALNDIYRAALSSVRDEVPLRSDLVYTIQGTEKKGQERVYKVRISWGSDESDGKPVEEHIQSLEVPSALPTNLGDDKR